MKRLATIFILTLSLCVVSLIGNANGFNLYSQVEVQFVNNAADPTMPSIDVYVNGINWADDLNFREATPFLSLMASGSYPGGFLSIAVAPGSSNSSCESFETYEIGVAHGEKYIIVFSGVLRPNGYAKNPDGRKTTFNIFVKEGAKVKQRNPGNFDVFVSHGVTDAPGVDVIARGNGTLVNDALYEDMTGYLRVPVGQYILDVTLAGDSSKVLASFSLDLPALYYQFAFIMASGFLTPASNQNGAGFGLYVVLVNGTVVPLPLAAAGGKGETIPMDNSLAANQSEISAVPTKFELSQNYPNPFNPSTTISFRLPSSEAVTLSVFDIAGEEVSRMDLGSRSAGSHQVTFSADGLPSGKYFYRLKAGAHSAVRSMLLIK